MTRFAKWLPLLAIVGGLAGCSSSSGAAGLDRRLVGTWYWETSVYLSETGPIKSSSTLQIAADGTFTLREEGTHNGVRTYQGKVVQRGDSLVATTDDGQTNTYRFALSGSNGLRIGNRLYEKK